MTNVVKLKNSKCIEWTVQISDSPITLVSETFLFLHRKCYLKLVSESHYSTADKRSDLYFNYYGELKAPINLSVCFAIGRIVPSSFNAGLKTIRITNTSIWSGFPLRNVLVTFEVKIYGDPSTEDKCVQTYLNAGVSLESLSKDFSKLMDSGLNHDAEIKCGKHSMKAHKNILCARSEVFKAMLESDTLEGRTGIVEIQDMDISCVRDFVRYLYTGAMPEMTFEKTKALYEAGDKYDVRSLMLLCSGYLQDNLSPENACQCLALADIHSDRELKERIITYILDEKIYLQDEFWLPVCENYPRIAVEVYRLLHKNSAENATTASPKASAFKALQFSEPRNSSSQFGRQTPGSASSTSEISSNFAFSKSEALTTISNCVPKNTVTSFGFTSTNFVPSKSETLNTTSNCGPENTVPSFGATSTNFVLSKSETLNTTSNCVPEDTVPSFGYISNNFIPSKSETLNTTSNCVPENTVPSFGFTSTNFVPSKSKTLNTTSNCVPENTVPSFGATSTNFVLSKSETLNTTSNCVPEDTVPSFGSTSTNFVPSKSKILNTTSNCVPENTVTSFAFISTNFVPSKSETPNTTSNCVPENTVPSFGSTSTKFVPSKSKILIATSSCVSEDIDASFESISTNFGISKRENLNEISCSLSENTVPSFGSISTKFLPSKSETHNATSSCMSENIVPFFESISTNSIFSKTKTINATSSCVSENTVSSYGSTSSNFVFSNSENPDTTLSSESENTVSPFGCTSTNFMFGSKNVNSNQIPSTGTQSAITTSHLPPPKSPMPEFRKPHMQLSCDGSGDLASGVFNFKESLATDFQFGATSSNNDKKRNATASGFYFGAPSATECKDSFPPVSFDFGAASIPVGLIQLAATGASNPLPTKTSVVRNIRRAVRKVNRGKD